MVNLPCRNCGSEVASDDKSRKCRHCGELFPFACAVCAKKLRPPIPDYPVERFFNDEGEPLCEEHYQRQCPECSKWFRADENPGFFLCPDCTHQRENEAATSAVDEQFEADEADADETETTPRRTSAKSKAGCGVGALLIFAITIAACLAPVLRAAWP